MPVVEVLRCDAPGCSEVGEYVTINVNGVTTEVILGPDHRKLLDEMLGWGRRAPRRARTRTASARRSTEPHRLERLLNADNAPPGTDDEGDE